MDIIKVNASYQLGNIISNLDEVAESVAAYCDTYKGVVVTEETVKDGKQMLANIRKEKKALDDTRKEIKNAWNKPYTDFEAKFKKVIGLYDGTIAMIDGQVKELEEQRKKKKNDVINQVWDEIDKPEGVDWLTLADAFNPKWLNATYKEADIKADIETLFSSMALAVDTVKMQPEFVEEGLETLKATKDLQTALRRIQSLIESKKIIEAKKKFEEQKAQEEPQKPFEPQKTAESPKENELDIMFAVSGTDMGKVITLLEENGINFRII